MNDHNASHACRARRMPFPTQGGEYECTAGKLTNKAAMPAPEAVTATDAVAGASAETTEAPVVTAPRSKKECRNG
jgi:hypothetical protein